MAVKVKRSFVPAYYQVADDLSREIEAGRLRPGDVIPSESQLCVRYGISRMTVRQGLNLLGEADYIRSVPGKGSFVSAPRLDRIALEFREGVLGDGRRLEPELVGVEVIAADAEVAERLSLTKAAKVVEFRRLSHLGAKPVAFEQKYLPYVKGRPLGGAGDTLRGLSRRGGPLVRDAPGQGPDDDVRGQGVRRGSGQAAAGRVTASAWCSSNRCSTRTIECWAGAGPIAFPKSIG